ncbi:MAG: hypothetical protein K1X39_12310, partial [Thermoflexales bacterium]|nr:hypothetical protein [Thermoflexales bacterium]
MSQTSKLSRKGLAESALRIAIAAAQVLGAVGGSAIGLIRPPATEALIGVPAAAAASTAADAASAPLASDVAAPSAVLLMTSAINGTTQNACAYTNLYDSGGASANYSDNESVTVVLDAGAGLSVKLAFSEFRTETNFDFLTFYDGATTSANLIGRYHSTGDLPP